MKETFYFELASNRRMAVDIAATGSGLEFGIPHPLFSSPEKGGSDVTGDGQRFLCLVPAPANPLDNQLTILLNWRATLASKPGK
jgi:hypothetical protein